MNVKLSRSVRKYQTSNNRIFLKLKYVGKLKELGISNYGEHWISVRNSE